MKRIIQILESFAYGDAIGNHTLAIHKAFSGSNIQSEIYANSIDERLIRYAKKAELYINRNDDIIIYHFSTGSNLNRKFAEYNGKKIINYHNITPSEYFVPYNPVLAKISKSGYNDIQYLSDKVDMVIADSYYNAEELRKMGYTCEINVVPIIINFSDYEKAASTEIINKYDRQSKIKNIIFVGRIAPNKKQEDIILDFYYYTKFYNPDSKLILVGNYNNLEGYYLKLKKFAKRLGLKNVIFTGHIKFSEILAYYKTADLFLCESEHEGFCVPLVEAMYFNIPIIAYDSSAVGETLGNGGILIKEKNPKLTASIMDSVINNANLCKKIEKEQIERLKYFDSDYNMEKLLTILDRI